MRFIKWKILIKTSIICLLPILLGVIFWNKLPDTMAIHFDINNNPDNFASKGVVVFLIPVLMVILQCFCCVMSDINTHKRGECKKVEAVTKWIIPVMTIVLQVITLGYGMGWNIDIRKVAAIIIGLMLMITGNYLPKLDYIKNYDLESEKARKINRFIGYEMVILGMLFIISILFPPVATILCLVLMIPYTIIGVAYAIKVQRR